MLRLVFIAVLLGSGARGCQLSSDWRHLSEGCRSELAQIILYAKVLAVHQETHSSLFSSMYNYLPWQYESGDSVFFYSAEIELLCDQGWGSMLEVPAGSRLNITGLGYFDCYSYTVVQNHSYFFFLRMDDNYSLLPHGVNFQDAIFADTQDNWRLFSSLFQYSNCSQGQQVMYELESQEDSRLMCSSVQSALFEEEDRVKKLQQKVASLEKRNKQLRDRVKKVKKSLRQAKKNTRNVEMINRKLNEKLSSVAGQITHINSFKQKNSHSTYLKL
ncbi:coiled-coil domain-containing protein 3 [Pseudophryne corroboree]|uniref:coiled-coil domain-containing protein 3 n=1 Tax=Pseudophryne corroboree TaxID=495146 RepID=UPI00308158AC